MLSDVKIHSTRAKKRLNAPSGTGYFLTGVWLWPDPQRGARLNAPSGAGCFLTSTRPDREREAPLVLMHLLVLGAF